MKIKACNIVGRLLDVLREARLCQVMTACESFRRSSNATKDLDAEAAERLEMCVPFVVDLFVSLSACCLFVCCLLVCDFICLKSAARN